MFKAYQKAAFKSFDPNMGSSFDPTLMNKFNGADGNTGGSPGTTTQGAKPGQKMQVNLTLENAAASALTFELWYYLNSMLRVLNPAFVSGNYKYIPQNSYEGIRALAAGTDGTVGANQIGDVVIRGLGPTPGPADPVATISCNEIAYASFFEASSILPFIVSWFRYGVTTSAQIKNNITWKVKTFSGGILQNTISPNSYFDPNQFQDFTLDILTSFDISTDRGLELKVNAGETVTLALFIQYWTAQTLGGN